MANTSIEHFKCEVKRFDTIDYEIRNINQKLKPLQDKLKELKQSKKTLESTICNFMSTNEIAECKLSEGSLLFKESKNVIPLSKENIRQNIIKFYKTQISDEFKKSSAENKAEILFNFVYENREYKENKSLKRV
jgi:hypothetical protein